MAIQPAYSKAARAAAAARRTRAAWWLATCFGIGWLRPGPGTYASIAALLVWLPLLWTGLGTTVLFALTLLASVACTVVGIPIASIVAREAGVDDPGFVVIDEAAGTWTALLAACLPVDGWHASLPSAVAALVLFRVFDIWKPWPVSALDRMHGGAGIILDDIAAGGYSLACVLALRSLHWLR